MPSILDCPSVQLYTTNEIAKIQLSITRIIQGLDPSSALKAMKDSVVDGLSENASDFAKAAAEGIGSEFTEGLIKGIFDQVLDEVMSSLPPGEARSVADKIKGLSEINFSMIQLVLQLSESSPLVMASKAKSSFIEIVTERSAAIKEAVAICRLLRQIVSKAELATDASTTIAAKVEKSYSDASLKLEKADTALLDVYSSLSRKVVNKAGLDSAKGLLLEALQLLSPLDRQLGAASITTNQELIGLLQSNVSDTEIVQKLLKSNGVNSFDFDQESVSTLREEGMSPYVERIFISMKGFPRAPDPVQIIWKKAKDKITDINRKIQELEQYEVKIPNILNNYLTIKSALEEPKAQDIHAGPMYGRIITKCRTMISKIRSRMSVSTELIQSGSRPGKDEFSTESIGGWIAEISVILSLLETVQQGMYEDRKENSSPLNNQFFKLYENSFKSFQDSGREWTNQEKMASNLSFSSGIRTLSLIAGGAHAVLVSKNTDDIKRRLADMDKDIKMLDALLVILESNEKDAISHLDKYSPEPEVPDILNKLLSMVKGIGFDRVYDELNIGGLINVINMPPELGTYIGAAAACLRMQAQNATNEFERRKFEKAALKLSKKGKSIFLGKVNMSMRSVQAVKSLKSRLEEILSLAKNLFETDLRIDENTLTDGLFTSLPNL